LDDKISSLSPQMFGGAARYLAPPLAEMFFGMFLGERLNLVVPPPNCNPKKKNSRFEGWKIISIGGESVQKEYLDWKFKKV
jgi:hypothetical protein